MILASVAIGVLAIIAGVVAAAGFASLRVVPLPSLTPIAESTATPAPEQTTGAEPAAGGALTENLSGQNVWLAQPSGTAIGVAYVFPDAQVGPQSLLSDGVAVALLAEGWAVATGDMGGLSWGSPGSTQNVVDLRGWVDSKLGQLPALYLGAGMGGTTALTSLERQPSLPVACWYAIAPISDLVTLVGVRPEIGGQIASAWGGEPSVDDNPLLQAANLPQETIYRVVAPSTPQVRVDDANALIAALENSGHTVTSVTAPENATMASLSQDVIAFAQGCVP